MSIQDKAETEIQEEKSRHLQTEEELLEEWAEEADQRLQMLNEEVRDLRASKRKTETKLETLVQTLFEVHTDHDKSLHQGNWDNDFDHGTSQGWLEAMEMVIFNLEKIKREVKQDC
jgi:hypothetical protein